MKLKWMFRALLLAGTLAGACLVSQAYAQPVDVMLFTSPYCPHCRALERAGFIEDFTARHGEKINLVRYDVTQGANNVLFYQTLRERGVNSAGIPALVVGQEVLQGWPRAIGVKADEALQKALSGQQKTQAVLAAQATAKKAVTPPAVAQAPAAKKRAAASQTRENALSEKSGPSAVPPAGPAASAQSAAQQHRSLFNKITFWAIAGAGLADGINPCAFAVIVFFISFLSVYKYNRKEILLVGTAYCASVFTAYVLLGFGCFHFLYAMKGFAYVTLAVQWATAVLCAVFFLLSLYDFVVYTRTKKSERMLLQLPKSYKEYIHKVMRFFLKDKQSSWWRLLLAACAVGFVVSVVEAVCTGQVYLPTIMVILKEADSHFYRAAGYLLLYNLMFIAPLALVFALALCGKESAAFNNWLKKHLGLTKLLLCGVFLGLLVLLLANMF